MSSIEMERLSDRERERERERERAKENENARDRESGPRERRRVVERERFAIRAIPERFSLVCLDEQLALHSASCEHM